MIIFSGMISYSSIIGRLLRLPLRLIPSGTVIPILLGKAKGNKWIVGSGNHGCWLGSYEYRKQIFFAETITPGSVVYDIGAHVGFYTLLAARSVSPGGKVIAFEPVPQNIYYLKEHLRLNRCSNVIVFESAIAERSGFTFFEEGQSSFTGRISSEGTSKYQTVSIDSIVLDGKAPPPDIMKIDVEGAEMLVFSGAIATIQKYHPIIFLATHGRDVHQKCCELLYSLGYDLMAIDGRSIYETDEIFAHYKPKTELLFNE